jgi:hypothetical protein
VAAYWESNKHLNNGGLSNQRLSSPQPEILSSETNHDPLERATGARKPTRAFTDRSLDVRSVSGSQAKYGMYEDHWSPPPKHPGFRQAAQGSQQWRANPWTTENDAKDNAEYALYHSQQESQKEGVIQEEKGEHEWEEQGYLGAGEHARSDNEIDGQVHAEEEEECWDHDEEERQYQCGWVQKNKRIRRMFVPAVNVDPRCLRYVHEVTYHNRYLHARIS